MEDSALRALFVPFSSGALAVAPRALFLRARGGPALQAFRAEHPALQVTAEQSFRPFADALTREGVTTSPLAEGRFPLVLVLPPRQRTEGRALLARALEQATPDGLVVASTLNTEGARSMQDDFEKLAGSVQVLSKHKCRVVWAQLSRATLDTKLMAAWRKLDTPQPIEGGRFMSRPGIFAWDHIDAASALLAAHLPTDLAGQGADLGAGYGYLAAEVLARCPAVTAMDLYEAEARALDLAKANLEGSRRVGLGFFWHDVTAGVSRTYDFVVMNPPFHQGREDLPDLGRAFVRSAAAALKPDGRLLLVANRHLPYEDTLRGLFTEVKVLVTAQGFKVVEARR